MKHKWDIKSRVLFIALTPATIISLLLGFHLMNMNLHNFSQFIKDYGHEKILTLASQGLYGVLAKDGEALRKIARNTLNNDIASIAFYDNKGQEITSVGKLTSNIKPYMNTSELITYTINQQEDTIDFAMPITLPEAIIDDYVEFSSSLDHPAASATIIGYVQVKLDRQKYHLKEQHILLHSALIILLGLSISAFLALKMSTNFIKPILILTNAVKQIKLGKLNTRINSKMPRELAILESGINTMAVSLQRAHKELQDNINQATADLKNTLKTIEKQNAELETAKKEAENASKVKSEFLASMSHELRTPLNGIIGFINLLKGASLNEIQKDYLTIIQKSSNTLLSIINDVLDFCKLEAGILKLDLSPMNIIECVEDILTLLAPSAHEKANELIPFFYNNIPKKIIGDPLRIKQVLTNLISNAIKFTENGSIVVRVMLHKDDKNEITLCIAITDTGIGLSHAQQKKLFQAFNQVEPQISKNCGGAGLGLFICKKLVEQMHGKIKLESAFGKGATFWFTIKANKISNDIVKEQQKENLKAIKILLFERQPLTRLMLVNLLEKWGLKIQEAKFFNDIIKMVKNAFTSKDPYQLVIIGINQLEYEKLAIQNLIDAIKKPYLCPVGILANTIDHMAHNDMLQNGAILCMAKPICQKKLYNALCDIFIRNVENIPKPCVINIPQLEILVVDDNLANLKLASVLLEKLGICVTTATSGNKVLDLIYNKEFNLILMDIHMPDMDGIETAMRIRKSNSKNKKIPIVALSAHILLNECASLEKAGINDYLTKPVNENQLKAAIYKWTQRGTVDLQHIIMPNLNLPSIDWKLGKDLAAGKIDLAKDMLSMLVKSLPKELSCINQAYANKDFKKLKEYVHKLHGACCYACVPRLKGIVKHLETTITYIKDDPIEIQHIISMLNGEIENILVIWRKKIVDVE